MPADFYGGAMAGDSSAAYIAGGYSFSSGLTLDTVYKFVPASNTWSTLASMPQGGDHGQCGVLPADEQGVCVRR